MERTKVNLVMSVARCKTWMQERKEEDLLVPSCLVYYVSRRVMCRLSVAPNEKPRGWPSRRNNNDFFKKERKTEHTVEVELWARKVLWMGVGGKREEERG